MSEKKVMVFGVFADIIAERDQLRAELAAAKERSKQLETAIFDAHYRAFGSRHYAYVDSRTTLDLLVADVGATQHERDRLAADNARLREALAKIRDRALPLGLDRGDSVTMLIAEEALAATPAQSLAAHDVAVKVEALLKVAKKLRLEESTNSSMHAEFVEAEADRIEMEAQRG